MFERVRRVRDSEICLRDHSSASARRAPYFEYRESFPTRRDAIPVHGRTARCFVTLERILGRLPIAIEGKANSAAKRLKDGETVTGQVKGAAGAAPKTVKLQAGIEFYTEDELE